MNLVAIVGRPNVGKSTLFNRLVGQRQAIVEDIPGVTRDRIYGYSEWNGKRFMLVDTGGFIPGSEDVMERSVREQAMIAIEEADVILFVCDGRDGVTSFDMDIANILRSSEKPVVLIVNKCDNSIQLANSYEFYSLGLGEPYAISALSGFNTGDFLDVIAENLQDDDIEDTDTRLKLALVGRPNVGKSSLSNALLGKDRSIVTDIPGTTRDSIDSVVKYYGEEIVLVDTAGLRKRSHINENVEMYSTMRTMRAIERCDIGVVLIDATRGLEEQDKKIINLVSDARKGIIIAVNKWDLIEKDHKTADEFTNIIRNELRTFEYVPIVYISALTRQRITKIIEIAKEIDTRRKTRIKTSELNATLLPFFEKTPPPAVKGLDLRINYVTQVGTEPPVFAFFLNHPHLLPDSYKRFMERILRENFDFVGTPISFVFRRKNVPYEELH
ncbi:MAG TPA: ribosome biogenesis GTPase Der [Candidatus Kapabacteria bacterium]|jgi:GTP-binding protein|nr:ribosome biogenesis GTPase Der [Candidatus Kapabacteria bacterium]HOM04947.1 ribosome biogenesis GTPase Der [Candidatus Kapabacteria bacterium]HPP39933.1 ribosome biogenesis GTPase Der [Candidatus Kapabacteria bacterium]